MLDLKGALKHDPKRYEPRKNDVLAKPLGLEAPKHFTKAQVTMWEELLSICLPDVLANADRWILEATVKLMQRVRSRSFKTSDISALRQCLSQLGMTPADRSRVSAMKQETKSHDEWSDLIQ